MAIAIIDEKGRIQIPEKMREDLCLKSGEEFKVKTEGKKITLLPLISAFI
jgi:AbrB family looped-hinge helix DNA binding protein